jgi:zinc protease
MQTRQLLQNRTANPATVFNDTFNRLLYSNHPRKQPPTVEMIDKMDLNKSMAFYKERFEDAGDFIFIFVGSIDLKVMQQLVETYLGALPNTGRKEKWKDLGIRTTPRGVIKEIVKRGKEPKSTTRIAFTGDFNGIYDINERGRFKVTAPLLQNRLRDVIRESLGGTYDASVFSTLTWLPVGSYMIIINFSSDPERVDELTQAIFSEIKSFKESGPTEDELADVKEAILRSNETNLEQNSYWLARLQSCYFAGVHPDASQILLFADSIEAVTAESAHDSFRKYYDMDNYIQVTLLPEESRKEEPDAAGSKKTE